MKMIVSNNSDNDPNVLRGALSGIAGGPVGIVLGFLKEAITGGSGKDVSGSRGLLTDNGFYGHMTVKKSKMGRKVKIIGTGE